MHLRHVYGFIWIYIDLYEFVLMHFHGFVGICGELAYVLVCQAAGTCFCPGQCSWIVG